MVAPMLDNALAPALDSGACPHLAVLLRNDAEFAPVVASFYLLGAKRGGLLAHRAAEVEADRQALAKAGLDVAEAYERAMTIERAWEARFGGRPVVTLCPYVVEGLEGSATLGRFTGLAEHHDGVLVPSEERLELFKPG
jgi:hypothetical protein